MSVPFAGRVLIAGDGARLGRAMAEAVSARGADVTVIARSKARLAEAARMELKTSSAPEACLHQRCDAPSSPTHLGSDPRYRSGVAWGLTVADAPVGLDT